MKLVIRFIWFIISMLIYIPAMRGMDSVLLKALVGLLIFFLAFYIPSNACIAMFCKNPKKFINDVSTLFWQEVRNHIDWSRSYFNYFSVTYYWAAFYYCFLPIFKNRNIEDQVRSKFISDAVSLVSRTESTSPVLLRDFIEHAFDEAIVAFIQDVGDPLAEGGPNNLFYVTARLCDPDDEMDDETYHSKFKAFASSCVKLFDEVHKMI